MEIKTFDTGFLNTNCYILTNVKNPNAIIIDPGGSYKEINRYLSEAGKKAGAVLLTHGHFDHILDAKKFQNDGAIVFIGEYDEDKLYTSGNLAAGIGYNNFDFYLKADRILIDGEEINLFGFDISVISTPGHSEGSLCFIIDNSLFSGDTLFFESYGRTDFYDGDDIKMAASLKKLFSLPYDDLNVYPGHGTFTSLSHERENNPICAYLSPVKLRFLMEKQDYLNDVEEIVRAYYPMVEIDDNSEHYLKAEYKYINGEFKVLVTSDLAQDISNSINISDEDELSYKKITKRLIKNAIYLSLRNITLIDLPYGSLTGVRPSKLFYELEKAGENPKDALKTQFFVSDKKINLIENVVKAQKDIIISTDKEVDIFINIPFCPSRCIYCSFISNEISKVENQIDDYLDALDTEIKTIKEIIAKKGLVTRALYVGGGTPTSLNAVRLFRLMEMLKDFSVKEFTVEAGRPDSIDYEKLSVLSSGKVSRISINPQTFNDNTLELIGRKHTVDDIYRAYELSRKFNFDINMDLIAMLPKEGINEFKKSITSAIKLSPENITVHTLSIKKGSKLAELDTKKAYSGLGNSMIDYSYMRLSAAKYSPYYMYRQKSMCDNLENTGYAKENKQCIYNVDIMEETCSVLGAGAGAISKKVDKTLNKIEREGNPKFLKEYLERGKDLAYKKIKLFI